MAKKERRKNTPPVPQRENLAKMLNSNQLLTLHRLENYGWQLKFVRRPLFQDPVLILYNATDGRHSLLEADGSVLPLEDMGIRDEKVES
ncbi:MAG: hypothetical protein WED00_11375 [Aquisalimonadaceae bacterium]